MFSLPLYTQFVVAVFIKLKMMLCRILNILRWYYHIFGFDERICMIYWKILKIKAIILIINIVMSNFLVLSNDRITRFHIAADLFCLFFGFMSDLGWRYRWEQELWKVTHTLDEHKRWEPQCWDMRKTQDECHIDWFDRYLQCSYPHLFDLTLPAHP